MKTILLLILTFALFGCGDDINSKLDCPFPEYSQEIKDNNGVVKCVMCFDNPNGYISWFSDSDCAINAASTKDFCSCYNSEN